jgi:hypothetical protein
MTSALDLGREWRLIVLPRTLTVAPMGKVGWALAATGAAVGVGSTGDVGVTSPPGLALESIGMASSMSQRSPERARMRVV